MDLSASVERAEKSLRMVVRELLPDWQSRPGAPGGNALEKRRGIEQAKRVGAHISNDLLDFANLGELLDIIRHNYEEFGSVFPDEVRVRSLLTGLNDYRNTINHYRALVPAERDYLSGICGLITNLITKYKSDPSDLNRYYSRIISIKNHLGVELADGVTQDAYGNDVPTVSSIEVGETVTFDCVGSDPRERELSWRLFVTRNPLDSIGLRAKGNGNPAQLGWEVKDADYGSTEYVLIRLSTPSQYKRHHSPREANSADASYDDERYIKFTVLPPWDEY